jgi:hypothetical protein
VSGLSSGEGLIWAVRDHDEDRAPTDKRLLVLEAEFAAVLKMTAREGGLCSAAHKPPNEQRRIMRSVDPSSLVMTGPGAERYA